MNDKYIEVQAVSKNYKNKYVLKDCNISIEKGKIYGVVGPNGAGKTTLFRLLLGLSDPSEGCVVYDGGKKQKDSDISFGAIIERPYINPDMTAFQNLKYMEILGGKKKSKDEIQKKLELVGLANEGDKKVKKFSLGMKQRLGIAMAVMNNPDVLILDEPMNGLDPEGIIDVRNIILEIFKKRECTILISSHILAELDKLTTDYIFIREGRVLLELNKDELENVMAEKQVSDIEALYLSVIRGQNV